jgi:hypothetical protein
LRESNEKTAISINEDQGEAPNFLELAEFHFSTGCGPLVTLISMTRSAATTVQLISDTSQDGQWISAAQLPELFLPPISARPPRCSKLAPSHKKIPFSVDRGSPSAMPPAGLLVARFVHLPIEFTHRIRASLREFRGCSQPSKTWVHPLAFLV